MEQYFDIFGTPIPLKEIKEFRIVQKEYIYRPVYQEYTFVEKSLFRQEQVTKYRYVTMAPYAAIIDESDRRFIFSGRKEFKENLASELLNDVRDTIGDKLKLKAIKSKRYLCMNQTGRVFQVYLDEVPVLVQKEDGRPLEVDKDNPLFSLMDEAVVPAIDIVPALMIRAKENYIFWGNGIQIDDISSEYNRLKLELSEYNDRGSKKTIEGKSISVPKLPKFNIKKSKTEHSDSIEMSASEESDNIE